VQIDDAGIAGHCADAPALRGIFKGYKSHKYG
jgi:hypothetical protein